MQQRTGQLLLVWHGLVDNNDEHAGAAGSTIPQIKADDIRMFMPSGLANKQQLAATPCSSRDRKQPALQHRPYPKTHQRLQSRKQDPHHRPQALSI